MAKQYKKNRKPRRKSKIASVIFAGVLGLLLVISALGYMNADLVRIRRAEVALPDLPEAFDGTTVLYICDVDLCGTNTPEKSGALVQRLQSLSPDILILGGDYTSNSLWTILNRADPSGGSSAAVLQKRKEFFQYIGAFQAPLGKFAISSPEDPDPANLSSVLQSAGITPLLNDRDVIRSGDSALWLCGICNDNGLLEDAGRRFDSQSCVLAVAYSPSALPVIFTSEAKDGGPWADLVLCGHTHGGQIRIFGQSILALSEWEQRFLSGWHTDTTAPVLVSQGLGCEAVNLRYGSSPEVWLITLRRPA